MGRWRKYTWPTCDITKDTETREVRWKEWVGGRVGRGVRTPISSIAQ